MERTKKYSVVNTTLKALKNQGISERYFQKGHSFSSQARYGRFDTSPYLFIIKPASFPVKYKCEFSLVKAHCV